MLVLVVEDEALVAMMLEDMLGDLGHKMVGPAATVSEALDLIVGGGIDCGILDVNLSGECAYPVADELKRRGIPFSFATGYGPAGVDPNYRNDSIILAKPFNEARLTAILAKLSREPVYQP